MTTGHITYLDRRRRRASGRPAGRRYGATRADIARVADGAGYDAAIARVWHMHRRGIIDEAEAGRRHHPLIEMRDGRPVVA